MLLYVPRKKFRKYWRFLFPGIFNKKFDNQKLLLVIFGHKINFEELQKAICQMAEETEYPYKTILFNSSISTNTYSQSFIKTQFNYYPVIWMCKSKRANNLVNKMHEWTLRLINNENENRFNDQLKMNNEVTFHVRNTQKLMIKVYFNGLSNSQMKYHKWNTF